MIKIAVVEDEERYRETFLRYLRQYEKTSGYQLAISVFTDGDEILEKYEGDYDVILMDIMMTFVDGMTAAERIREVDEKVIIIFITNMTNYAIKGYQVRAFDYILKPISYFAMESSLNRAIKQIDSKSTKASISINVSSGVQKIMLNDLRYVESDGHYINFYTVKGVSRSHMRIKDVEEELKNYSFFRINKGLIVNLNCVEGILDSDCIVGDERLPISRGKKKDFMKMLNINF